MLRLPFNHLVPDRRVASDREPPDDEEEPGEGDDPEELDPEPLEQRAAAARGVAPTDKLLELVEPAARQLGSWELVAKLRGPPEALRQLEVGEREGPKGVVTDVLARSER